MASDRLTVPLVLECHLHSRSEGTTEVKFLPLSSLPHTVLDLKQLLQEEYSVPVVAQTITYQTEVLTNDVELSSRRLRSGDSLNVSFLARGDCQSVEEVNAWLENMLRPFEDETLELDQRDYQVDVVVYDGIHSGLDCALGYDLFEWLIPRTMVNKAYFEATGGLELLFKVYRRVLSRDWPSLRIYQKYLENVCTQAFANFGETAGLRRKLVKMGVLELCFKSLLRTRIRFHHAVADSNSSGADQEINDTLLKGELDNALHLLCCIAELPECQMSIASRLEIVTQTCAMALSPSYPCQTKALASEVFLCLAHTSSTHTYLAMDIIISSMLEILETEAKNPETTPLSLTGLRCFTLVWMSIVIIQSPSSLHSKQLPPIKDCICQFLSTTHTQDILNYETDRGTIWATLIPYVKLFYLPAVSSDRRDSVPEGLEDLALTVVMFFLHSKVFTAMYHTMLEREELIDFVVSLPWYVPSPCRERALELVSDLRSSLPSVAPPRLLNLAKAQLAKDRLGLKAVLELSVGAIASCFYSKRPTR